MAFILFSIILPALLVFAFVAANDAWDRRVFRSYEAQIIADVKRHGGRNVTVNAAYRAPQGIRTCHVTFSDYTGQYYSRTCQTAGRLRNKGLFWESGAFDALYRQSSNQVHVIEDERHEKLAHKVSSKEQIISDLVAENERLRAELAQVNQ